MQIDANCPVALYQMVYEYYLMTLLSASTNYGQFEWRFDNKSDISLFRNCRKDDVLTSVKFEIMDCEFYLELTPDGWGDCAAEGTTGLWLAISSLPEPIKALSVEFTVNCKEIEYEERKVSELSTTGQWSFSHDRLMERQKFINLPPDEGFSFECTIVITQTETIEGEKRALKRPPRTGRKCVIL